MSVGPVKKSEGRGERKKRKNVISQRRCGINKIVNEKSYEKFIEDIRN